MGKVSAFRIADFSPSWQRTIRAYIADMDALLREWRDTPKWRWLHRAVLLSRYREIGIVYRYAIEHAEQEERDRILLGRKREIDPQDRLAELLRASGIEPEA